MEQPELEAKITAWRARLIAALPGQEETVRELEEHLRDHIEGQMRRGRAADAAFTQAVARLGEPRALAREFARVEPGWRGVWQPAVVVYVLTAVALFVVVGLLGRAVHGDMIGVFEGAQAVGFSAGYLVMLAAGMVGLCVLVSGWNQSLGVRELLAQQRELRRAAAVGSACMALTLLLHGWWAMVTDIAHDWSHPFELGLLAVALSLVLLWVAQRPAITNFRTRVVFALLGVSALTLAGYRGALTPVVPFAWLYASAFFSHGAVVLLHVRLAQAETEGRMRSASV